MRWVVEASSVDKTESRTVVVEAESWQSALQTARAKGGEEGPVSGFAIELLEDGYRAVDPITRVRFIVKRAPDEMPSTTAATATAQVRASTAPPRPAGASPSAPPASLAAGASGSSAASASMPPPASAPLAPVGASLPGLPKTKLLSSREQEPTQASPLTYREYAFAVPAGTSEDVAARVLKAQLELVKKHLASAKMGKLVNLAVFDVEFTGKPPRAPVATLTWKDWKEEPVLGFPRRAKAPSSAPPPAASAPPPAAAKPPAAPAEPETETEPTAAASSAPADEPASAEARDSSPTEATAKADEPKRPSSPDGMVRTPSGRFVRGRTTGEELITSLFEAMHDLHFLRDALDGGQFCLALAMEVLPARAAFIHFFDVEKREWVIACARGKDTSRLLTSRTPDSDELLREAARARRAILPDAASATAERYQGLGGNRSIVIAPIMQAGRALGAIEIVSPLDDQPFNEDEANAMTYIAEQYAEYLGSRGIVLDRARIEAAAGLR